MGSEKAVWTGWILGPVAEEENHDTVGLDEVRAGGGKRMRGDRRMRDEGDEGEGGGGARVVGHEGTGARRCKRRRFEKGMSVSTGQANLARAGARREKGGRERESVGRTSGGADKGRAGSLAGDGSTEGVVSEGTVGWTSWCKS